ncbi:MAG: hypothetical protein GSR80_000759 [Desulfurococcales archaeon]|nr:hypothetical protein [Desulfurococcales archaeon]
MPTWIRKIIQTATKHGKKEEEQKQPPDVEAKIAEQFIYQIRSETLREAAKAVQYILQYLKQHKDPAIEALYRAIMDIYSPSELHKLRYPEHIILIAMARALQKGIKDPIEIAKYALAYHSALQKQVRKIPHFEKLFANETLRHGGVLSVDEIVWNLAGALEDLEEKGLIKPGTSNLFKEIVRRADLTYETWILRALMAEEVVKKRIEVSKQLGIDIEPYLKEIEQELGLTQEKPQAKPTPGAAILAHPDRYPTLAQKVLLKALILGEHLRQPGGIHRDLYRALRNLLTTPLTTANWYPLLAEWFEDLEAGHHKSPLTHILQKLPLDHKTLNQAYAYLAKIEQGTPLDQIPQEEKEAFKTLMERVKEEIWRNPTKYLRIADSLLYTTGLSEKEAIKALVGLIDDLAKIHAGEKTPRQIGIERDAAQVIQTIKNLPASTGHTDPYTIASRLREIIETHIQHPLLRNAYQTAIQHYLQTYYQLPRDEHYLEAIAREERRLEEKLKQLQHGEERLTDPEASRIAMLYRTLMLLTPHPTLEDTKKFYSRLAGNLKIRVGDEEFLPVHGPVAEDIATSFSAIRKAAPEERDEVARREIASYEPLLYAAPHIEKKVASILSKPYGRVIPEEEYEGLIRHLANIQVRGIL